MTKQRTTLELIKEGWGRGYSATLRLHIGQSVQVIGWADKDKTIPIFSNALCGSEDVVRDSKITGWLYAGQLAGNTIEEGDRFRVKETGEIGERSKYKHLKDWAIELQLNHCFQTFYKGDLEPYFKN